MYILYLLLTFHFLCRLWRRRFLRKKYIREQNRISANAALSSLNLGPPIRQCQEVCHRKSGCSVIFSLFIFTTIFLTFLFLVETYNVPKAEY